MVVGYPLSIYFMMREYGIASSRKASFHSDILADSVSAKITSNPEALKSAIRKLRGAMADVSVMPSETIGFNHMFVGPIKAWPVVPEQALPGFMDLLVTRFEYSGSEIDPLAYQSIHSQGDLWWGLARSWVSNSPGLDWDHSLEAGAAADVEVGQRMTDYIRWQKNLLEERLINLDLIEGGRWQMFEGKKRKEIVKPSALR